MADLIDFQIEIVRRFREMRRNYLDNVRKIKDLAKDVFGKRLLSVYVFGSVVEGKDRPMSDFDVAIVLSENAAEEERMKPYRKIREHFGLHPFEIHVLTLDEWEGWYRRFVKRFVEV
jgi:predicted nucleotidyltransferase